MEFATAFEICSLVQSVEKFVYRILEIELVANLKEYGARMSFGAFVLEKFCKGRVVNEVFWFCGQNWHLGVFCLNYKKSGIIGNGGTGEVVCNFKTTIRSFNSPD